MMVSTNHGVYRCWLYRYLQQRVVADWWQVRGGNEPSPLLLRLGKR